MPFATHLLTGALALLGLLAPQAKRAPAGTPTLEPWNGTYEDAAQHARERNVPLVLFAIVETEGEPVHEDVAKFVREIFSQPEFLAAGQHCLVAIGANRVHELTKVEVGEGESKSVRQVCSVYRTEGCQWHQKLFDAIYREHNDEGELRSPAAFVLAPDGTLAKRWMTGGAPPWDELIATCVETQKKAGEGLTEQQFVEVRGLMLRGASEMQQSQWGQGYATWAKLLTITTKTRYAHEARKEQARALENLTRLRDEGHAWLEQGKVREGYRRLVGLVPQCSGTPLEKELARAIAGWERDKRTKDEIAALKREIEAAELWREAQALASEDETRKAEAKVRLLLRKYDGTPAAELARAAYPELAAEADAKKQGGGGE